MQSPTPFPNCAFNASAIAECEASSGTKSFEIVCSRAHCGAPAGDDDSGALWLTSSLRLPQVFAAAQLETLQQRLSRQAPSETPFLLQAFVTAPNLVEGDPNPRLLILAKLLVQGARLNGSAKAAGVAANVIQDVMLVSVCRGFHTEEGSSTYNQWHVVHSHTTCLNQRKH